MELNHLSKIDIESFLNNNEINRDSLEDMIKLDNGYWISRSDIAYEGFCNCERDKCVDHDDKVWIMPKSCV
ncbi:hypothetical protein GCM10022397_06940 [Flavivirga jejuensis]